MDRNHRLLAGLRIAFFGALFLTAAVLLTRYLWNWLMPELFHLPSIGIAQTVGLLVLSRILFGGFGGGRRRGWAQRRKAWQQRMAGRMEHLSPEAREKFRQQMQNRCSMDWRRRPEPAEATGAHQPA